MSREEMHKPLEYKSDSPMCKVYCKVCQMWYACEERIDSELAMYGKVVTPGLARKKRLLRDYAKKMEIMYYFRNAYLYGRRFVRMDRRIKNCHYYDLQRL